MFCYLNGFVGTVRIMASLEAGSASVTGEQSVVNTLTACIRLLIATLQMWLHRLWLVPFLDAVPDPFLHVPRSVSVQAWHTGVACLRAATTCRAYPGILSCSAITFVYVLPVSSLAAQLFLALLCACRSYARVIVCLRK